MEYGRGTMYEAARTCTAEPRRSGVSMGVKAWRQRFGATSTQSRVYNGYEAGQMEVPLLLISKLRTTKKRNQTMNEPDSTIWDLY